MLVSTQLPEQQVRPHTIKHPPQLNWSPLVSTQAPPQPVWPPGQQIPPVQCCPAPHATRGPHWHCPPRQLSLVSEGQAAPHPPQLLVSVLRSAQPVPQQAEPAAQQVTLPELSSQHVWSLPQQPCAPVLLVQNSSPHGQMVQVSLQQYWPLGQQPSWHGVSPAGQELHALLTQYWPSAQQKPTTVIRPVTIENDG
jgi:hypothetical protein